MSRRVLSAREAATFASLADALLAPAPPLPPITSTDTVDAFDTWMRRAPKGNRIAVRAALLALELAPRLGPQRMRWRRLARTQRLALLGRIERHGGRPFVEALRAAAAVSYYGDARVSELLGYVPRRP